MALSRLELATLNLIREALRTGDGMSAVEAEQMRRELGAPPCQQCGKCCRRSPCLLCFHLFGDVPSCPLLVEREGRYVCTYAETAQGTPSEATTRLVLSLGCGCSFKQVSLL